MAIPPGPSDVAELEALKPGDMIFCKLGSYPWWPATVAMCFQPKFRNMYRVGTEPSKSKIWVKFFNENSGAFVLFKYIRIFRPEEAPLFLVAPGSAYYEKQRSAIDMAVQDYFMLHPEIEKPENGATTSPAGEGPSAGAAVESAAPLRPIVVVKTDVKKRKRKPISIVAEGIDMLTKRRKKRRERPERPRRVVPADTDTEDDLTQDDNKHAKTQDIEVVERDSTLANGKNVAKQEDNDKHAHDSNNPSFSVPKSASSDLDTGELQRLNRAIRKKDTALREKDETILELKSKLEKLKAKIDKAQDRVRILLPVMPPDLPVRLPPRSKHATEEIEQSDFSNIVAELESDFANFEKECSNAQLADKALTEAARTAMATLQPLHNILKGATQSVLNSEQKVAKALKRLFSARISASDLTGGSAGKVVNRIAKRTVVNSQLLRGLAVALRDVWVNVLQEAGSEKMPDNPVQAERNMKEKIENISFSEAAEAPSKNPSVRSDDANMESTEHISQKPSATVVPEDAKSEIPVDSEHDVVDHDSRVNGVDVNFKNTSVLNTEVSDEPADDEANMDLKDVGPLNEEAASSIYSKTVDDVSESSAQRR
jgi:hypothetical protein